jgi:hypothetical protein
MMLRRSVLVAALVAFAPAPAIAEATMLTSQVGNSCQAVTPSDSTTIKSGFLYIGGAGDVAVVMFDGQTVTFSSVPGGSILPVRVTKVLAATDATNIIACY